MFKRLFWFTSGAATGAAGTVWARRRVQQQIQRFTPAGVRAQAIDRARRAANDASVLANEARTVVEQRRRNRAPES